MTEIHKGNSPKNARIKINYEGKKPTVRFSYPCKKRQVSGSMFFPIFFVWILIAYLTLLVHGSINYYNKKALELDSNCTLAVDNFILNNLTQLKEEVCYSSFIDKLNNSLRKSFINPFSFSFTWRNSLCFILFLFVPPYLIYFPFRKYWSNVYPKYQAWFGRKKIKVFHSKDVIYDEKLGYYCEIILFHNVVFNYEATKEFSKYMKEFEIREHNFRFYKERRKKAHKKRGKYVPPKTFNEFYWYARFYFTDKPRTGKLWVLFK